MAIRCRRYNWGATSLGPVGSWPIELRVIVRSIMDCAFPVNLWCGNDKLLIYNDAYIPLLGAKHPYSVGRAGYEVWSDIASELKVMFTSIAAGEPVYAEDAHFVMQRSDGHADAWFTYSLSPVRADDGSIVAYLNIAVEVTKRVLTDAAMREARGDAGRAEHRLREVFARAPAFIAVLHGPLHVFDFVNVSYAQLVGQRAVIGMAMADALPEIARQGFVAKLDEVYRTGTPFEGREVAAWVERVPGQPPEAVIVDFVFQPIDDVEGKTTGIVVHGTDVTEIVLARAELQRLRSLCEIAGVRTKQA